jgi:hypothetical protein
MVIRATEATVDQMLDGLVDGIDAIGMMLAEHAKGRHPKFTDAQRKAHQKASRERNPDGSFRFFSRTGTAVGSIAPIEAKRSGDTVTGGMEGGSSEAYYLTHLEYGTSRVTGGSARSGGVTMRVVPAYPSFRPAGDAIKPKAPAIMERALRKAVKGKRR